MGPKPKQKPKPKPKPKPKAKPKPKPKAKAKPKPKSESRKKKQKEGPGLLARLWAWILSWFRPKEPGTPIQGCGPRMKNILFRHFRGIFGILVPLCALTWQGSKERPDITVQCMWLMMSWFFLLQPVAVPATSFVPIFLLPMAGVMPSTTTCQCYMDENIVLFILTSMLILCLNNSGVDRRLALWFLSSGDACQFGGKRLIFKCCTAGFFMSMISSRLMAASILMQYITKPLMDLQIATAATRATEPCYDKMRYVVASAISTSCAIGSIAIMHAAPATLAFRTLFHESGTYPDIFNYLQYSAFAFPTAAILNIVNFTYHMFLLSCVTKKTMSIASKTQLRTEIMKYKNDIPKIMTRHEVLTIFFVTFYLMVFFTRWCKWLNMGWADYSKHIIGGNADVPGCMDATTAAIFVLALHSLPKGYSFWHVLCARKKSKLAPLKRESAILFWRFVDKNLNYAYMFLFGSGVALVTASASTGLNNIIANNMGKIITNQPFKAGLFIICVFSVILANIMPGVAGLVIFLPFVIGACSRTVFRRADAAPPPAGPAVQLSSYIKYYYLCNLAVGLCSSFGFMCPFLYTPAYFSHFTGKVPKLKMAKYGLGPAILCCCLTWASLVIWAPYVWDPTGAGILPVTPPEMAGAPPAAAAATTSKAPGP